MDSRTFALTELTYQVPGFSEKVELPTAMLASINPSELEKVTSDALKTGITAELNSFHFDRAVESRQSYLDKLHQTNADTREIISETIFRRQRIAKHYIDYNVTPPAKLLDSIFDGLLQLEKPIVSDALVDSINLAISTVRHAEQRAAEAKGLKTTLYEQTLLAKEIEVKQKHLGKAARIGSALISAVILGGCGFGVFHEAAQARFNESNDSRKPQHIGIGVLSLGVAYVGGLNGYIFSRRPAARYAQSRARRIVKHSK